MSRSGYDDSCDDNWGLIRYRGQVASAIRGARGQELLRETLAALDAMPDKRLITDDLKRDGCYCTLGVIGEAKGIDLTSLDPSEPVEVAHAFNVAHQLAREIVFLNDECGPWAETPEQRWQRMRSWVQKQIIEQPSAAPRGLS